MIHRQNWLDVRAYLRHIDRVRQLDPETVKRTRAHLRHLLQWADAIPLPKARTIDPTLPIYMLTARADDQPKHLAPASIIKGLSFIRQYFLWAREEWPRRYKPISESWIEMLQPPRQIRADSRLSIRQFYGIEDVLKIASVSIETLHEARAQVAVCMLFLSGMRADALASLPIHCVDMQTLSIMQLPEYGIRTKNRKAAITYLLEIPELLAVCKKWDDRVRHLDHKSLWYATLASDGMALTETVTAFLGRNNLIERDVRLICERAEVPYQSPHKLRHGHVVYAMKQARNMGELKAISQNIMHASAVVTDQVYGRLLTNDVQLIISNLGKASAPIVDINQIIELLQRRLKQPE